MVVVNAADELVFICQFVAGVGDVLPPFVRGSSLVACGIFIRNVFKFVMIR